MFRLHRPFWSRLSTDGSSDGSAVDEVHCRCARATFPRNRSREESATDQSPDESTPIATADPDGLEVDFRYLVAGELLYPLFVRFYHRAFNTFGSRA